LLLGNETADVSSLRFDLHVVGNYSNAFIYLPHLQGQVDNEVLANVQFDATSHRFLESLGRCRYGVTTRRQALSRVNAVLVGLNRSREPGCLFLDGYFGLPNYGTLWVAHSPANAAYCAALRHDRGCDSEQ
jgi:hypothetical protein